MAKKRAAKKKPAQDPVKEPPDFEEDFRKLDQEESPDFEKVMSFARDLHDCLAAHACLAESGSESWVVPILRSLWNLEKELNPYSRGFGDNRRSNFSGDLSARSKLSQVRKVTDDLIRVLKLEKEITSSFDDWTRIVRLRYVLGGDEDVKEPQKAENTTKTKGSNEIKPADVVDVVDDEWFARNTSPEDDEFYRQMAEGDKYLMQVARNAVKALESAAKDCLLGTNQDPPKSKEWDFAPGIAKFRGEGYRLKSTPLTILKAFMDPGCIALDYNDIRNVLGDCDGQSMIENGTIKVHLSSLRSTLREVVSDANLVIENSQGDPLLFNGEGWEFLLPRP